MPILLTIRYRFNAIISKSNDIFHRNTTNNSKFVWRYKRFSIAKIILRKKKKMELSQSLYSNYSRGLSKMVEE